MSRMYPTAYLEHYADLYAASLLHRHGITLDQYLADPDRYEAKLYEPFPLLRAQTRTRVRLYRDQIKAETEDELQAAMQQQNGAFMEPMHSKRRPKRRGRLSQFRPTHNPHPQTI